MKKIYFSALLASLCNVALSQGFIVPTSYRGAFAPAPETPWTQGWTDWDPQNTVYGNPTVTITTSITTNTTWTANNIYLIQGQIYVKNGATLTIEPGTVIMGDKNSVGAGLFITQGSKLNAEGTAAMPIVFTSNQPAGQRALGDWGGIIIMGRANNNQPGGIANIEGLAPTADTQYGGGANPDDNDNSGVLKYVRVEFGGYVYQPNKEINGITFGAVGKGTTVDYVQVSFCNDDAYEWFGGNVNCRHLVSYRNLDDDFDTDNGYSGKVQFGLSVRDPQIADNPSVSTSEGFESDNNAAGDASMPQTSAIFTNMTLVGPLRGDVNAVVASGYRRGARIRRNSGLKIYNSIFMDHLRGIHIDGTACEGNATNEVLKFENNINAGFLTGRAKEVNAGSTFGINAWYETHMNDSVVSTANILINPYDFLNGDYRPAGGSIALTNFDFTDAAIDSIVIKAPTATTAYTYCVGENATMLTATALTNGCTIKWYDAATAGNEVTMLTPSTAAAGTFNYFAAQINGMGIEGPRTQVVVTVNANPAAPVITANGSTSFCTGGSVVLTSDQTSGNMWSTTENTQSITVTSTGDYSVTYTDANGCSAVSSITTVNVSATPIPTVTVTGDLELCEGESVVLTSSTGDTYAWSNSANTQSITVTAAGTYHVTVTNTDACDGVGQSADVVVVVNAVPTAGGSFTTSGNVVTFTNTSTGATSYSWDFGDQSSSSAAEPSHAFVANGTYTVTLTALNASGCSDVTTFDVAITVGLDELSIIENVAVYPNPASTEANVRVAMKQVADVTVSVLDLSGKEVVENNTLTLEEGVNNIMINTSTLPSGMYYVNLKSSDVNKTIKLSVNK